MMSNEVKVISEEEIPARDQSTTIKHVLDHGFVRLVSYMQPVAERHSVDDLDTDPKLGYKRDVVPIGWTGDLEIVRNARVSYDADWRTGDHAGKDEKLIRYMLSNLHTSPFEAMTFTFEVKAPIFVFRQWHRHRTWSYNEVSARYAELPEEFYVPSPDKIGVQHSTNKQSRVFLSPVDGKPIEGFVPPNVDHVPKPGSPADPLGIANLTYQTEKEISLADSMRNICINAFKTYRAMLGEGVPREIARSILPLSTYSRMFATVDLHNLMHFLHLRLSPHAQYEIRVYAEAIVELITPVCPVAMKAFKEQLA